MTSPILSRFIPSVKRYPLNRGDFSLISGLYGPFSRECRYLVVAVVTLVTCGLPTILSAADQPAAKAAAPEEPVLDHALVAGFERFFQSRAADVAPGELADAGRLLLGELNCVSCHQADGTQAARLSPKQAPILDEVGSRLRPSAIRKLLNDPHAAKSGTTMPHVLAKLPDAERSEAAEALTHFLAKTGGVHDSLADNNAVKEGEKLYHQLGCVACHTPFKAPPEAAKPKDPDFDDEETPKPVGPSTATFVPLGNIPAKYTLPSLMKFLRDPQAVRPSSRMPHFNLQETEARQLASYFLRGLQVPPNVHFEMFEIEGGLDKLPDFSKLTPKKTGMTSGLDLEAAGRTNNFAMRFRGYLHLDKPGKYRFFLGSDDGSRLLVDGKVVVDVDGIHPHQVHDKQVELEAGAREIVVEYFQIGGEWTVALEVQGPGFGRQSVAGILTPERERPKPTSTDGEGAFTVDEAKAARGRELFASTGCASCHQMKIDNQRVDSTVKGPSLSDLKSSGGCLAELPTGKSPKYRLTTLQRAALTAAIEERKPAPATAAQKIEHQFLTFNCYACHARGTLPASGAVTEKGGVENVRNAYFESTIHEIGDEGRLPPSLSGAGDKLNTEYLNHIWNSGAKDRPYVKARMPKFGQGNLPGLTEALAEVDARTEAVIPTLDEPANRLKSHGRVLMGDKGLSCVKCHPFNQYVEPGIQAINLNAMARRLREDWFHRYMFDPPKYRPGTRMPGFFPGGKSVLDGVLGGNPQAQLLAMWMYLKDGSNAAIPPGLIKNPIVLKAEKEPVIYRNFIAGLSPRGIAVGYPEGVNLAWDAERMNLGLIWQGSFIDASKHWNDRGPGFQIPLGDNVVEWPTGAPFARLEAADKPWPNEPARTTGYKFLGYRLNKERQPEFRYRLPGAVVSDFPKPVAGATPSLERVVTVQADPVEGAAPASMLYFRAARSRSIKPLDGGVYELSDGVKLTVTAPAPVLLRESAGEQELLVPVGLLAVGEVKVVLKYRW